MPQPSKSRNSEVTLNFQEIVETFVLHLYNKLIFWKCGVSNLNFLSPKFLVPQAWFVYNVYEEEVVSKDRERAVANGNINVNL